jgi:hypothetical protein
MIKVWLDNNPNPTQWDKHHSVILDWDPEFNSVIYVNDISESDVIVVLINDLQRTAEQIAHITNAGYSGQHIIVLNLFHSEEPLGECYTKGSPIMDMWRGFAPPKKILFLDQNFCVNQMNLDDAMTYDMLFQRQQVYHTEYEKYDLTNRVYTARASQKMYELAPISKNPSAKHFLAPMRTYENLYDDTPRVVLRHRLRQLLDSSKGYTSNLANGQVLIPQEDTSEIMKMLTDDKQCYGGGTWLPVHNDYYTDSIVSVYVETITYGSDYRVVTEKTYDPLIKGNFILPFGYRGLIQDIRQYGFKLPNWIDYSYDELDDELRWGAYTDSVNRLLAMEQNVLYDLCISDMDILLHNRNVFYHTPRLGLVAKIRTWLQNGVIDR